MNSPQTFFSVTDKLNAPLYAHPPKQSTLLEQAQHLIEEQQRIALVKQMLAKTPNMPTPHPLISNPPQAPTPTPTPNQLLTPRSMYSISSSPATTPRDMYAVNQNNDQMDLSNMDQNTLITLSETLAALEQLGSPSFFTPEMILQMAAQNTPKPTPFPKHNSIDLSPRTHYKMNPRPMYHPQQKVMAASIPTPTPNPYLTPPSFMGMSPMLGAGQEGISGVGLVPKLDFSQLSQAQQTGEVIDSARQTATSENQAVKFRSKREKKLYKTEVCLLWSEKGQCEFGDACKYAHGDEELVQIKRHPKYKSELCKHFTETGTCPFGRRCHFSHETDGSLSARAASSDADTANEENHTPRRLPVFQVLAQSGELLEENY